MEGLSQRNLAILKQVAIIIGQLTGPWVVAGDWNLTPEVLTSSSAAPGTPDSASNELYAEAESWVAELKQLVATNSDARKRQREDASEHHILC